MPRFALIINSHWCLLDLKNVPDLRSGHFLWWWAFFPLAIGALALRRQLSARVAVEK